ncbi:IucA/IucC family protein [Paenibacillus sp. HWE-109]|uniref:IucA/IucC family protein n=1 Tax=Paenibacillus sp. HWE-109 TaxID=1306526 RepID=UPI001EE024E1|nr:IucA/IucC family protein [Paenibacillus sp. HWE-109]UKS28462.1 IucA/IucC family protein [Paenibacillus sp. HWE-109]
MGRQTVQEASAHGAIASESQERICMDLVNALLAEGILEEDGRGELVELSEMTEISAGLRSFLETQKHTGLYFRWWVNRELGRFLIFPVRPAVVQAISYCFGGGVYEVNEMNQRSASDGKPYSREIGPTRIDAMKLLELVAEQRYAHHERNGDNEGASRLKELLRLSLEQTSWADAYAASTRDSSYAAHANGAHANAAHVNAGQANANDTDTIQTNAAHPKTDHAAWRLIALERQAAWRDRPFHPVAKAKGGWTQADYEAFSAEAGQPITLEWLAVSKAFIYSGKASEEGALAALTPADLLLAPEERMAVHKAMELKGLSQELYIALPVHPWQRTAMLPQMLQEELESGICIPLDVQTGVYYATSSARSLAPRNGSNRHLKLPLGIVSLGAVRYLPAVHMMNGERGQRLLEQAQMYDSVLKEQLFLCDEKTWWAYLPASGDFFADSPRHLSALIRQYPAALTETENIRLLPMSALAAYPRDGQETILDIWIRERNMPHSAESAATLFGEVCLTFLTICLRLFQCGVMPEIHGQNVLLILKDQVISGLLLRDHDSVRLHVPWMTRNGLDDPQYKMKPGYPNSLYNVTPQKLLVYLQTLGIQVNLYAILEAIAEQFKMDEKQLWFIVLESLQQAIVLAELPEDVKAVIIAYMLDQPKWPWKNLIRPLLEQEGPVSGSMPASMGETVNPFRQISRLLDANSI